jgi:hypothetical protein
MGKLIKFCHKQFGNMTMKAKKITLIFSCIASFSFVLLWGCDEQNSRSRPMLDPQWFNQPVWQQIRGSSNLSSAPQENNMEQNVQSPTMSFEQTSYDFGKIGLGSKHVCEFPFTNTGKTKLVISDVVNSCNCTLSMIENNKKEYAPGESGKIIAGYADLESEVGEAIKHIYVYTNDVDNPKITLALKVDVVAPVDYEPKRLALSLVDKNGGCPPIIVKSLDNKPFSITGFQSSNNCITVKFNPQEQNTQFVLEPQVDMDRLTRSAQDGVDGSFRINLSRPDCEAVSGTYYAPPRFSASPQRITISQANPSKSVIKTINIVSNYDEPFAIQPVLSRSGIIRILDTQRTRSGYQLTVEINPPRQSSQATKFSDDINIDLKGITTIHIPCTGYYPGAKVPLQDIDDTKKECKTCGPKRIDNPTFNPGYKPN